VDRGGDTVGVDYRVKIVAVSRGGGKPIIVRPVS
jgi:hypothetical protein